MFLAEMVPNYYLLEIPTGVAGPHASAYVQALGRLIFEAYKAEMTLPTGRQYCPRSAAHFPRSSPPPDS